MSAKTHTKKIRLSGPQQMHRLRNLRIRLHNQRKAKRTTGTQSAARIRVVRMAPVFNFALTCRGCHDARCVKACPERAITTVEVNSLLIIDEKKCKGCDWCVQACPHGGITIQRRNGQSHRMQPLRRRTHNASKHAQKKHSTSLNPTKQQTNASTMH